MLLSMQGVQQACSLVISFTHSCAPGTHLQRLVAYLTLLKRSSISSQLLPRCCCLLRLLLLLLLQLTKPMQ